MTSFEKKSVRFLMNAEDSVTSKNEQRDKKDLEEVCAMLDEV